MTTRIVPQDMYPIRPLRNEDQDAVVAVWHSAGLAEYTYLPTWQAFTLEQARQVFQDVIRPNCTIWVGLEKREIVAFLAMNGSYIDRLYVAPAWQRRGWGTRLVEFAKAQSPTGLELATHQANRGARSLYEKHGFRAVKFGISPPPESAPDVIYHWRPF